MTDPTLYSTALRIEQTIRALHSRARDSRDDVALVLTDNLASLFQQYTRLLANVEPAERMTDETSVARFTETASR